MGSIIIRGARQHNLKNVSLAIPKDRLVVITGMSGSGKSSLAFDTLYAEGQRRYVESLSVHARQLLGQLSKPDVEHIEGLSPAIAIEQRSAAGNPRSTIATATEIYDFARVLYSTVGQPHDPKTGAKVEKLSAQEIVERIAQAPEGTKLIVLAPVVRGEAGEFRDVLEKLRREGFVRARINGAILELTDDGPRKLDSKQKHHIEAVVDRLVQKADGRSRLAEAVETALRWGGNRVLVLAQKPESDDWHLSRYSTDFCNPETDFTLPSLTPKQFSFNSHWGACPRCQGLGVEMFIDPDLVIPDPQKTLADGAVAPWRRATKRMQVFYRQILLALAEASKVDLQTPYENLPEHFKQALLYGTGDRPLTIGKRSRPFEGLLQQMQELYETSQSEFTRGRIRSFMGRRPCHACKGQRLRPEILAVTLFHQSGEQKNIAQLTSLTVERAAEWMKGISLTPQQSEVVKEVVREVQTRLEFLLNVGLGYLNLNRESGTLSGGEAQRIRLATQIGSGLAGVIYVLDEPSIGLHQRDNDRLLLTLQRLRDLGNSVIVVEHDEDTIRAADHLIDMGPGAGPRGGEVIAQGSVQEVIANPSSLTGQFLSGAQRIPVPKRRVAPRTPVEAHTGWLRLEGAAENNLHNVDAAFPLGCLTCVTGVSGSGKSTLVDDILRRALFRHFYRAKDAPGKHHSLRGLEQLDKAVVVDQSPIGRTPRSNPATYTGAFGPIRDMFVQLPLSRVRGYNAGRFSFNVKGGRCEHCQGDGMIRVEMHFLPDVYVECEVCRGARYNRETLEATYKGKNISDVLQMSVDEAVSFFRATPKVIDKLLALADVGLGYLRLGQSGDTLSGGEAQRVKLAGELAKKSAGRCCYILDEPTTGLHFADIRKLLEVFYRLRDAGNTLIVIEHNLEVIKCADWVIDLGPDGGEKGGQIVAQGPPEAVAACPASLTGAYLSKFLP